MVRSGSEDFGAKRNQRGLRVLVVEDDRPTAETLALFLRSNGHEVGVAADGSTALEEAKAREPELIFVDIHLPGMDGYVVVKRIREQSAGRRPLLVALTGLADPEARRRSQEAGIDLHLVKPVDPDTLNSMLLPDVHGRHRRLRPGYLTADRPGKGHYFSSESLAFEKQGGSAGDEPDLLRQPRLHYVMV